MERYPISICMAGVVSIGAYIGDAMAAPLKTLYLWHDDSLALLSSLQHNE